MADPEAAEQLLRQADSVLADVAATVIGSGGAASARQAAVLSEEIGVSCAHHGVPPMESLRAAVVMFDVLLPVVLTALRARGAEEQALLAVATSLHESILHQLGRGAVSYASFLLTKVHSSHRSERRRIARELHDQLAHEVGVALQDLELHDVYVDRDPLLARQRVDSARAVLNDALNVVRHFAQELHELPSEVGSLERALSDYVSWRVPPEIHTKLSVANDIHPPNEVRQELYFVLREAIRNTVVHAAAQNLKVLLSLVEGEIHAVVHDDGQGFDVKEALASPAGVGLSSMRERLELLAGTLDVTSAPGEGTTISIRIPHHELYPHPTPRADPVTGERTQQVTIGIVDDHTLFRQGLRELLSTDPGFVVVGEGKTGDEALELVKKHRPEVLLLDVEMPGPGAKAVIGGITKTSPETAVIILTMHTASTIVRELLECGAAAYLVKTIARDELISAVGSVSRGRDNVILSVPRKTIQSLDRQQEQNTQLTQRELEVLRLVATAMSNAQIAARLFISEGTVKRHLTSTYAKLGAVSRVDAIKKAAKAQIIEDLNH